MLKYFRTLPLIFILCIFTLGSSAPRDGREIVRKYERLKSKFLSLEKKYRDLNSQIENAPARLYDVAAVCEGRLTTQSGTPISTTDRTAQGTLYFTPYMGNAVSLYDGSTWTLYSFSEISLALGGLTGGKNYDVFLYDNTGTLTLELSNAWTNDTTRADAISLQNGIYVKTGATTRRYLGTFRASAAATTEDSKSQRFLWNYINRKPRMLQVTDGTNSWTYSSTSWQAANASASNKVEYVVGLNEDLISAKVLGIAAANSGALNYASEGVGVDSATVNSATLRGSGVESTTIVQIWGEYAGYPGIGYHYLQWLEAAHASGVTFYGDNGDGTKFQSGLVAEMRN